MDIHRRKDVSLIGRYASPVFFYVKKKNSKMKNKEETEKAVEI